MTPDEIAQVCHEANRAMQAVQGDPAPSPPWAEAPAWQRESATAGVQTALTGARPAALHQAWCDQKSADGWRYGPVKDAIAKTHPCLVPYHELPPEQRAKDRLFAAIVKALA